MESEKLHILIIEGTNRPGRESIKVANLIEKIGQDIDDIEVKLADAAAFNFPLDGDGSEQQDPRYKELITWADAYFIVAPEYNHGYPGSLKRMLDSEYTVYIHKPVAIAGVSSGNWGGVRVIEALVPVLRELGMVLTFADIQFPKVKEQFDDAGNPKDPAQSKRILDAYEELIWMGKALKTARLTNPSKYEKK